MALPLFTSFLRKYMRDQGTHPQLHCWHSGCKTAAGSAGKLKKAVQATSKVQIKSNCNGSWRDGHYRALVWVPSACPGRALKGNQQSDSSDCRRDGHWIAPVRMLLAKASLLCRLERGSSRALRGQSRVTLAPVQPASRWRLSISGHTFPASQQSLEMFLLQEQSQDKWA